MLARTSHLSPLISSSKRPARRFPFSFCLWTAGNLLLCSRAVYTTRLLSHLSVPTLVCSHRLEAGTAPVKPSEFPWGDRTGRGDCTGDRDHLAVPCEWSCCPAKDGGLNVECVHRREDRASSARGKREVPLLSTACLARSYAFFPGRAAQPCPAFPALPPAGGETRADRGAGTLPGRHTASGE